MPLEIPSGSITVMKMNTPPTGWTRVNSFDNYGLRLVNGAVDSFGSLNYTSVFKSNHVTTVSGSSIASGGTSLSTSNLPSHAHQYYIWGSSVTASTVTPPNGSAFSPTSGPNTSTSPGPGSGTTAHLHPISAPISSVSGNLNFAVKYVDTVFAQRS